LKKFSPKPPVKTIATIFLASMVLVQSLFPRTGFDLLRSPEVWQHYREHQRESSTPLHFWVFLQMHYAADSNHTKQKKHHLPAFDFSSTAGFFVIPSALISFINCTTALFVEKSIFGWSNLYFFLPTQTLVCPPRA